MSLDVEMSANGGAHSSATTESNGNAGGFGQEPYGTSVFTFTHDELETALHYLEPHGPSGMPELERGFNYLSDHAQAPYYPQGTPGYAHSHSHHTTYKVGVSAPPGQQHQPQGQHMWYGNHSPPVATASHPMPSSGPASAPPAYAAAGSRGPPPNPSSSAAKTNGAVTSAKASSKSGSKGGRSVKGPQSIPNQFLPRKSNKTNKKGDGGAKGQVSHSVAEKQRRDRINTLIDELRELVPSDREAAGNEAYADDPSKRPKHVVLRDTITFVRVTLDRQRREQGAKGSQMSVGVGELGGVPRRRAESLASEESVSQDEESTDTRDSTSEAIEISVTKIESQASEKYSVNVSGTDRNGLLHDITRSLNSMSLEIKTAVIKTEACGKVSDTFEVDKSDCTLSMEEIERTLGENLRFESKRKKTGAEDGDKRKRK